MKKAKRKVLLVTGFSGAGLSTALKALEDIGYKAVDNLPLSLVDDLLAQKEGRGHSVAIGIDTRTFGFSAKNLMATYKSLKSRNDVNVRLIFIECQDGVLQQRFTETRRVHPLAIDRPVVDGVMAERERMKGIVKEADIVIDTTDLKAQDLRRILSGECPLDDERGLFAFVTSFGFKYGIPREADLVFDVRFLDNPHWDPILRPMTGLDAPVADKVAKDADYPAFFAKLTDLLQTLLPRYDREGKNYLTIAVGCTGGRHRSVFTAEQLFGWLQKQGLSAAVRHRDIERAGPSGTKTAKTKKVKRTKK